jgi:cellulose synthase/poly-beta-1,6-N-acetylglucosamine synthase-like glycosyltransferase
MNRTRDMLVKVFFFLGKGPGQRQIDKRVGDTTISAEHFFKTFALKMEHGISCFYHFHSAHFFFMLFSNLPTECFVFPQFSSFLLFFLNLLIFFFSSFLMNILKPKAIKLFSNTLAKRGRNKEKKMALKKKENNTTMQQAI